MTTKSRLANPPSPPLTLLGLEPMRALLEYLRMRLMSKQMARTGDGHPVIIFPGLAADGRSVDPLKGFCQQLGYSARDWGRGYNTGPRGDIDTWLAALAEHVGELFPRQHSVSLIGWSLGGIYAREVAKKLPGRVRQVITIGTPIGYSGDHTNVSWLYRLLNGQRPMLDEAMMKRFRAAPEVPTTSIFSRSDGVVAWQACMQQEPAVQAENIEVRGSHCGLVWNPAVFEIIADRLQKSAQAWRPYASSVASGEKTRAPGFNGQPA